MVNRLEPLNLIDFTGGLNLRDNTFQLQPNESPEMINISIDPLGGIYTRRGWDRWNGPDIVDPDITPWDPRRAYLTQLSDGSDIIYIASDNKLYAGNAVLGAAILDLGLDVEAIPHMADFATFGDDLYIARGRDNQMAKRTEVAAPTLLTLGGAGTWNDDYVNPVFDTAPPAELCEAHGGYLFVANIVEDGLTFPNRIRWSHPTSPEDWAQADYIDINIGGDHITALQSFEDHLLIFKSDSIWALYGYNADSWQVVQKSSTIGAISPQVITRSETAVFFFSASDRGGIYAYDGERATEISEQLRYAMEALHAPELVWVGWLGRKLWVTLPWTYDGPTDDDSAVFVFDPSVGNGAWVYYTCKSGGLGPIVAGSNTDTQLGPLAVVRSTETPCIVRLEALPHAADRVWTMAVLAVDDPTATDPEERQGYLVTEDGEEIIASGMPGDEPFDTVYRTPWVSGGWPTRKKSFRRPDFVCRITGREHQLSISSFRDYEEHNPRRRHTVLVPGGISTEASVSTAAAIWGHFEWGDGTEWGAEGSVAELPQLRQGASIRRGSSFGLCRSVQLRVVGATPYANWGVDAIILKMVMRRFR
jgi:hypothetical protein